MPESTHRLHITRIDTVGFVTAGDDPEAEIVFFKRAPKKAAAPTPKNESDMDKFLKALAAKLGWSDEEVEKFTTEAGLEEGDDVQKALDALTVRVEKAEADNKELTDKLEAAGDEKDDDEPDPLAKLDDETRAAIQKQHDEHEAAIQKANDRAVAAEKIATDERDKREARDLDEVVKAMPGIEGKPEEVAAMLKSARDTMDADAYTALVKTLNTASAKVVAGLTVLGRDGVPGAGNSAWQDVEKAAEALRRDDAKMTKAVAIDKVLQDDKDLADRYLEESRQA